jgi:hypothetical protein
MLYQFRRHTLPGIAEYVAAIQRCRTAEIASIELVMVVVRVVAHLAERDLGPLAQQTAR